MFRFSLMPKEEKFFDMFEEAAVIITRAAGRFLEMVTDYDRVEARGREIKMEEHACDVVVGRIIEALDQSFITPFDREDIHTLATTLDDVLDNMEETAHRFVVFRLGKPSEEAAALARIIHECCLHLEQALRSLRTLNHPESVQGHIREITRLENEADTIYRETDVKLFANPPEVLQLIKWRELYSWLEETVDACKDVALVISEIVIKGS